MSAAPGRPWWLHPYLRHLRLPFNLLLSPIYLWGVLLGGGHLWDGRVWLGYLSLHLFLYGGTTAFNSYYDRDEGPIGGMLRPPAVDRGLLPFALIVQALGVPLAVAVGPAFLAAWLLLFLVFTGYSHPRVRFKAHPARALAAIAFGQGVVGFALGWLAVGPLGALASPTAWTGMVSTALVVVGLYLVTQSYQTLEDRARGDQTLPVVLGPAPALRLAVGLLAPGGVVLVAALGRRGGWPLALVVTLFFACLGLWILRWAAGFDEAAVSRNFATAMRVATVASAGLSAVLVAMLIRAGG